MSFRWAKVEKAWRWEHGESIAQGTPSSLSCNSDPIPGEPCMLSPATVLCLSFLFWEWDVRVLQGDSGTQPHMSPHQSASSPGEWGSCHPCSFMGLFICCLCRLNLLLCLSLSCASFPSAFEPALQTLLRAEVPPLHRLLASCTVRLLWESLHLCLLAPAVPRLSSAIPIQPPALAWKPFKAKVTLTSKMLHLQGTFEGTENRLHGPCHAFPFLMLEDTSVCWVPASSRLTADWLATCSSLNSRVVEGSALHLSLFTLVFPHLHPLPWW